MSSIVLDLQREALDSSIPVSNLLRKALVVATKLNLQDFGKWIEIEMGGYKAGNVIPLYRIFHGTLKALTLRGWIPVALNNSDEQDMFSKTVLGEGVSAMESMLDQRKDGSFIAIPVLPEARVLLNEVSHSSHETDFRIDLQFSQVVQVVDTVRNMILKWTMDLEKAKILGEGMTFTVEEKQKAVTITYNNTFHGPVQGSQIQQGSLNTVTVSGGININEIKEFFRELENSMKKIILKNEDLEILKAEMATIKAQLSSPKPKQSILKESLQSIRHILEHGGGAIAAELILRYGHLLPAVIGG